MPKSFDDCRAESGRIRTMVPNTSQYFHLCFPSGGGPAVKGETHQRKSGVGTPAKRRKRKER